MSAIAGRTHRAFGETKQTDWVLILSAGVLLLFGLMAIFSVDYARTGVKFFPRQLLFAVIGVGLMVGAANIHPDFWKRNAKFLYILNIVLLLAVVFVGERKGGAVRWVEIGPMQFQPSELSKILGCLTLGAFYAAREDQVKKLSTFLLSLLHIAPAVALLMAQPHLGGTLCIVLSWLVISLYAGVPWKYPVIGLLAVLSLLVAGFYSPKLPDRLEYMKERIVGKLEPDPRGNAYQQTMAVRAIGAGGLLGQGFLKGEVKAKGFIPVQQNDFIFTVIGEEAGMVGAGLLFLAFLVFLYRVWQASIQATSLFGRLVAGGLLTILAFHTIVNLGMNLGVTPVVGLWLPFVSYGGTALWMCMVSVGLLLAIRRLE